MDHDWCSICGNRTENNSIYCSDTCSLVDQLNAELSASTVGLSRTSGSLRHASVIYDPFSANSTPSRTLFNSPLRHRRDHSASTHPHTSLTRASAPSLLSHVREPSTVQPTIEHLHRLTSSLEGQRRGELWDLRLNHDQQNRKNSESNHRHQSHDGGNLEMGETALGRRELHSSDLGLPSHLSDIHPGHQASFPPLHSNGLFSCRHPSAARGIPDSPSDDPEQQQGLLPQRSNDSSHPSLGLVPNVLLNNPARILFATSCERHNSALSPLTPRSPSVSTPTTTTLPSPASTPASTPPPDPPSFFPPTTTEPVDFKEIEDEHRALLERRRRRFERGQGAEALLAQWAKRLGEVEVGCCDYGDFGRRRRVSAPLIRGLESPVFIPARTSTSEPSAADMYNILMLS
ncbi:hypothetical protein BJ742DRAFT_308980 [Cladochytrium replicatum]|nr:hypothetical protein BJ742DRAFT_308980 [Cladochytrium replicatum]